MSGYDDELTETGAGLRVYRHPPLQAVAGMAVWRPNEAASVGQSPIPINPVAARARIERAARERSNLIGQNQRTN